jgi:HSP20 family molecular chaperone IbpA
MAFVYNEWLVSLLSAQVGILEITFKKRDQAKPKGKKIRVE